jgi:hypothetical protein
LIIGAFLAIVSQASALTLGATTPPTGGSALLCPGGTVYWQSATDLNYSYAAPFAGTITSWSTYAAMDTPGSTVAMVILRPTGSTYTVVATDTETIPDALPVSSVATFDLSQPIAIGAGDVLGLSSQSVVYGCGLTPGSTAEVTSAALAPTPPSAGTQYTAAQTLPTLLVNLSANFVQNPITAATPPCQVTKLAGARLAVAKTVLQAHNCRIGKTTKKASVKVAKGHVISTNPGAGKTLAPGAKVNIVVSSGPAKHKKKQ